MLKKMLWIVILLLAAAWAYVRFSGIDEAVYHVDPVSAETPTFPGYYRETLTLNMASEDLVAQLEAIILETPRTTHLAGDLEDDFASYTTRSAVWGFVDVASVKITETGEDTSELTIFSRLRQGYFDVGVNEARVKDWLSQLTID